jgi:AcrR family transcriptional regulator
MGTSRPRVRTGTPKRVGSRRYASAAPAMQKMLEAAESVLRRDGYHAFSTRRVAAQCGVSLGHLTYYFPAKNDLLQALIAAVMTRYTERIARTAAAAETRSAQDLRALLDWLLRDAVTNETSALFRELWVLAKHDAFAAREVLAFYERLFESFAVTAARIYPTIGAQQLRQVGHLIGMLTEGGTVLFAGRGERSVSFDDVRPMAIDMIMQRLESTARQAVREEMATDAAQQRRPKTRRKSRPS